MTLTLNPAHPLLPLPRPSTRRRGSRRPFAPSKGGVYRLPHDVCDRLAAALTPFRNRDAAFALAVFLARFWSTPARLLTAFPIDRRELADHAALGLTEARVRGAIRALEEVGFLDRALASGSTHRPTPDGLHRKPVLFTTFPQNWGKGPQIWGGQSQARGHACAGGRRGVRFSDNDICRGPACAGGARSGRLGWAHLGSLRRLRRRLRPPLPDFSGLPGPEPRG